MFTDKQIEELVNLLCELSNETRLYFGCDSIKFKKLGVWYARYATVCVVHMNGRNGCRVFRDVSVERDYDVKPGRPSIRLMNEVAKVCELYTQLAPFVDGFECSVHLDVNLDPKHGSNCVASQAAGYVLATTGLIPLFKPNAWAASFGADWSVRSTESRICA